MKCGTFRSLFLVVFFMITFAGTAIGFPNIGGFDPDKVVDDIEDIVDQFEDIRYIIENPGGFGLGLDQDDPITTSLDDATTDVPFLDSYPHAPINDEMDYMPICELPRGGDGYHLLMPGRYSGTFETFCLHAGTHGPGSGDGYLYAPLKGPWKHIITGILKTSEVHPEIPQRDVQYLIWAVLARTRLSEMSDRMQPTARTLISGEHMAEINAGALDFIPRDQINDVFGYFEIPPELQRTMRAESEIRYLATSGSGSFADLEAIAILSGNPEWMEGDREIPAERWSYNPDGYFIRHYPHGYSSTDYEIVIPDNITIEVENRDYISFIEDEHGNRITIDGNTLEFTCLDPMYPSNRLEFVLHGLADGNRVPQNWENDHRATVRRLVGDSRWVDFIVELGKLARNIELRSEHGNTDTNLAGKATDLAMEAWMNAVIRVNMEEKETIAMKAGSNLPDYDWRDSYRPLDPTDDSANPGSRGRQRLGGRQPRPTEDADWGEGNFYQDFDPDSDPNSKPPKNPKGHKARKGIEEFNNYNGKLGYLQNGLTGSAISAVGFAIPNAVFGGLMEYNLTLWDYCIGATSTDPPRPDYDEITTFDNWTFTPLVSPGDGPADRVAAQNHFMEEGMVLTGYLTAAVISVDRHGGAVLDGDNHWALEQAKNVVYLKRQSGWQMYEVADALDALIAELNAEGFDEVYVTAEDFAAGQDRLRNEGWTPEQLAAAEYFEFTDSMMNAFKEYRLSLDPEEASGSVMDAARNLSVTLRELGNYWINLPDVREEDIAGSALSVSP